jgi:hypothetical protein
MSIGGKKYYVSFIDDYSKFTWIYPLKFKSEVFQKIHEFQQLVERMFNRNIITIQTDWGGKYQKLHTLFTKVGITHQVSCPHTHQQNGSAERKHRHIVEVGLALLAHASLPLKYWEDAFLTATYLINRTPSRVIQFHTPLERLLHIKADYSSLRIFGCACWPNLRPYNSHKFQFRSTQCVFLGYSSIHKGVKCLDPSTGRVYVSRDVVFDEAVLPFEKMHKNTGRRLLEEINLLPHTLLNSNSFNIGGNYTDDYVTNSPTFINETDPETSSLQEQEITDQDTHQHTTFEASSGMTPTETLLQSKAVTTDQVSLHEPSSNTHPECEDIAILSDEVLPEQWNGAPAPGAT